MTLTTKLATLMITGATLLIPTLGEAKLLEVGDSFPAWTLPDHSGQSLSSDDLVGKRYLLWFYPKAMTPGCTIEGQTLRDRAGEFRERGVEILGISFDSPADNAKFVKQEGFPFRLLSDEKRSLAVEVGAATDPSAGYARRISYLVNADGIVEQVYGSVSPDSHAEEVLGDL